VEELLEIPLLHLAAGLLVTLLAAFVQGVIGLGFAIFSVPILSLIDPRLAPVPQLFLSVALTFSMAYRERHAIQWRTLGWVLFGRIPGAILGAWLLTISTPQILDLIIGGSVLAGVLVFSTSIRVSRNRFSEVVAGIASGAGGTISSIGGPPLALLYRDEKGETIRANLATIFLIGLVTSIGARAFTGRILGVELLIAAAMLPALFAGVVLSGRFMGKIEGKALRISVLAVSAIAALALLLRALL
jgi:uncharacterized membrane protein YfcA